MNPDPLNPRPTANQPHGWPIDDRPPTRPQVGPDRVRVIPDDSGPGVGRDGSGDVLDATPALCGERFHGDCLRGEVERLRAELVAACSERDAYRDELWRAFYAAARRDGVGPGAGSRADAAMKTVVDGLTERKTE